MTKKATEPEAAPLTTDAFWRETESATDTKPKQGAMFDIWIKWKDKQEIGGWSRWYMTHSRGLSFTEAVARLNEIIPNEIKLREGGGSESGAAVYVIVPRQGDKL